MNFKEKWDKALKVGGGCTDYPNGLTCNQVGLAQVKREAQAVLDVGGGSHGQEGHAGLCWGCDIPIGDVLIDDLAALYSRNNIDMLAELRKRGLNK